MRHRPHAPIMSAIVVLLVLPPVAQAGGSWGVRNKSGSRAGTIVRTYIYHWHLLSSGGRKAGEVNAQDEDWIVAKFGMRGPFVFRAADGAAFTVRLGFGNLGRAKLSEGRWVLQRRVHGQRVGRGSVSGKRHGEAAAAGRFVLLW